MDSPFLILDGAMGSELTRRRPDQEVSPDGTWSARALIDYPNLVSDVHDSYIKAGSDIITTNTYSTIPSYLSTADLENEYVKYTELAGEIARSAARAADKKVLVAGSIPPLSESYRFDLVPDADEAIPIYENMARALLPYVDIFICETMSTMSESANALGAIRNVIGYDRPVWVSWTLSEEPGKGLRNGESITDAFNHIDHLSADAFLFNCTHSDAISVGLKTLGELTDKPTGGYPNRVYIPKNWKLLSGRGSRYEFSPHQFVEKAKQWKKNGAQIFGGCCGIGPDHISLLADTITKP